MSATMRILIAPLNWGLGHATRCIPLIKGYMREGWEVTLASDGAARSLLQAEFPLLECHELPGYGITYPRNGNAMVASMASQLPKLTARVTQEKKWLDNFLKTHPQDLIVSDSRYGLHSHYVKSVVICHQTKIRSPSMEGLLNAAHARLLNRFDELWIPDDEQRSLSGELSSLELKIPVRFLGALSRFKSAPEAGRSISVLALLSGPEPQRSMLEELLFPVLKEIPEAMMIRGRMDDYTDTFVDGLRVVGHALSEELEGYLNTTRLVLCRSGYSSIMDLVALNKKAVLIPTPGQTEQEYLAERLSDYANYRSLKQDQLSDTLALVIKEFSQYSETSS